MTIFCCADFINDYEGITANEQSRGDIALTHFVTLELRWR
jgi:hypothetical protein